ncbi:MAG: hypothetical protein AVDCRST_MAG79-2821, partial [uncultured Thermoleophilia bacterium]
ERDPGWEHPAEGGRRRAPRGRAADGCRGVRARPPRLPQHRPRADRQPAEPDHPAVHPGRERRSARGDRQPPDRCRRGRLPRVLPADRARAVDHQQRRLVRDGRRPRHGLGLLRQAAPGADLPALDPARAAVGRRLPGVPAGHAAPDRGAHLRVRPRVGTARLPRDRGDARRLGARLRRDQPRHRAADRLDRRHAVVVPDRLPPGVPVHGDRPARAHEPVDAGVRRGQPGHVHPERRPLADLGRLGRRGAAARLRRHRGRRPDHGAAVAARASPEGRRRRLPL